MYLLVCGITRKISKGIIHVEASFNHTIVTITYVRGRVISWSFAGTCGFKGTRREHLLPLKLQQEMLFEQYRIKACNEQKS